MRDVIDRMADKFTVGDDCWEWTGAHNPGGYGRIGGGGKRGPSLLAHRVLYERMVGPIPDGLTLDHLCRNPSCVRPDHLEPVTNRENILRGTSPVADRARQTHCIRGHAFTAENTYTHPQRGTRHCRACDAERRGRA